MLGAALEKILEIDLIMNYSRNLILNLIIGTTICGGNHLINGITDLPTPKDFRDAPSRRYSI